MDYLELCPLPGFFVQKQAFQHLYTDNLLFDTTPQSQTDQKSVVAAYDRRGEHIFTGNERGRIMVFRDSDMELTASFRLSSSLTAVKSIEFARRGRYVCAEITQGKMASL